MEQSEANVLALRIKKYLENKNDSPPFEIFFKDFMFIVDSQTSNESEEVVSESLSVFFKENPSLENEMKAEALELLRKIYLSENSDLFHLARPLDDLILLYDCIN
ncbi:MAG: hypothetical protein FJX80_13195 [Bacteroidetes bacterium]|nr:hypothetical protein [Bacteroidota bacterium]